MTGSIERQLKHRVLTSRTPSFEVDQRVTTWVGTCTTLLRPAGVGGESGDGDDGGCCALLVLLDLLLLLSLIFIIQKKCCFVLLFVVDDG